MRSILRLGVCALAVLGLSATLVSGQTLVANAGADQSGMFVGTTVSLNGGLSTGATSFAWTFTKRPTGSTAVLVNATTATPHVVPDRGGLYTVKLTVGNGSTTKTDTVNITTANRAPIANAGPDASGALLATVTLSGLASTDPDVNPLTYTWTMVSAPPASVGLLTNATKSKASLKLDRPGTYVLQLVVKDGLLFSAPDQVSVTTTNNAPVAKAGPDRKVALGALVQLDGSASYDLNEQALSYSWTLTKPSGSTAVLDQPTSPLPRFTADKAGTYTATLTVGDGLLTAKDTVVATISSNRPPVAQAGLDEKPLQLGQTIQLDATESTDSNGQLLTHTWSITARPSGSVAVLSDPTLARPTFTADRTGTYTFSLVAKDAGNATGTDTRLYSAALPQANAGPDQVVNAGDTVTLDGSASLHLNGGLTYGWALLARPAGSVAELDDPGSPEPQFVADLAGVFIAQLVVFDGLKLSVADTVVVTTNDNVAPRVELGPNRKVTTGVPVLVDAAATDANGDPLTYAWALVGRPAGSTATLSPLSGSPTQFTPDVPGDYVVQLIASDPGGLAGVDTLLITTGNTAPTVDAGPDSNRAVGVLTALHADAVDPDGGGLSFSWRLLAGPAGTGSVLANSSTDSPSFTPDRAGVYVAQVIVRDALNLYAIDAVVIRAINGGAVPTADAGAPQIVTTGNVAQLDGTASSDPEGAPLTYLWHIVSMPAGSLAVLSSTTASQPTVLIDVAGPYVLELVVSDGVQDSVPDQVTITGKLPIILTLTPKAVRIASNASTQLTVTASETMTSPLVVTLTNSNPALLGVPPTVTIPIGQASVNFNVTGSAGTGGALVTASIPTSTVKATVAVGARLVQWTDDVSGLWSDATHWSDDIVPGIGDVVVIDRPAGNFVITVDTTTAAIASLQATEQLVVPGNLVLNGAGAIDGGLVLSGQLSGAGSARLDSAMTWGNASVALAGGLDIAAGRVVTLPGSATPGSAAPFLGGPLRNFGTVAMGQNCILRLQGPSGAVINEAGGLWTTADGVIASSGPGAFTFTNYGTLRKVSGVQRVVLQGAVAYTNAATGKIEVLTGNLQVGGDGDPSTLANSALIHVAPSASFNLQYVTLADGTTFTGGGTLTVALVTTVTGNITITLPTILTGTLTGSGTVHLAAPMSWGNGSTVALDGGLEVTAGRVLTLPDGQGAFLKSPLRNFGTVAMGQNSILLLQGPSGAVINEAGGLWTTADGVITTSGPGSFSFTNHGTLRKSTGALRLVLQGAVAYANAAPGKIEVLSGNVQVGGDGDPSTLANSALIHVATGASFNLQFVTLADNTTFTGGGTLTMPSVTTITGNITIPLPTILTGTLTGPGTVHLAADMTWHAGATLSVAGGLDVLSGKTLTLPNVTGGRFLSGSSIHNHGTVAMNSSNGITLTGSAAAIVNESGASWTFAAGNSFISASGPPPVAGAYSFSNAGTLQGAGAPTTTLTIGSGVTYSNTGTVSGVTVTVQP